MRDDLSNKLVHLTKGTSADLSKHREEAVLILSSILKEKRLRGGTGFIKGSPLAVRGAMCLGFDLHLEQNAACKFLNVECDIHITFEDWFCLHVGRCNRNIFNNISSVLTQPRPKADM